MCRQLISIDSVKRVYPQFIRDSSNLNQEMERLRIENTQLSRRLSEFIEQFSALNKLRTMETLRHLNRNLNAVDSNINAVSDCMYDIETRILKAESILLETESSLKESEKS